MNQKILIPKDQIIC